MNLRFGSAVFVCFFVLSSLFASAQTVPVISVHLGDARSGVNYYEEIRGDLAPLTIDDYTCPVDPKLPLPSGLSFQCDGRNPRVTGLPTTDKLVEVSWSVTVADRSDHSIVLKLSFTIRPASESVLVEARPSAPVAVGSAVTSASVKVTGASGLTLAPPTLSTPLTEGIKVLNGIATAPGPTGVVSVAILRVDAKDNLLDQQTDICLVADDLVHYVGSSGSDQVRSRGELLAQAVSGGNALLVPVGSNGGWSLTLAEALKEGDQIQVVQVIPAGVELAPSERKKCASNVEAVRYLFDFHRVNVTFVAGVLISNSSATSAANANFSQASQFYAINVDRAWRLPGWDCLGKLGPAQEVTHVNNGRSKTRKQKRADKLEAREADDRKFDGHLFGLARYGACHEPGWHANHANQFPGFSTFFEGRLSSIPVSSPSNPAQATDGTATSTTLLTSQKVFRVGVGTYLPWVVGHGSGHHPNGLFLAPLAKAGFDTVTGATASSSTILTNGIAGTLNYQTAYNSFSFGGRLGNMDLSASHDRAPKIVDYLDVTLGRYSNLQSYICHTTTYSKRASTGLPTTSCATDYPQYFPDPKDNSTVVDSRKQLYRLDIEGLIKIPIPATAIPIYIGFNANIAQHTVGAAAEDHGYSPPDDIRILFGTKIDVGTLLTTLNLAAH